MMKLKILALAAALLGSGSIYAQGKTAFVDEMVKHWDTSKALSLAVANAMPEDGYTFKATAAEMSFGEQMNHIALANANYCSGAMGEKSPMEKGADNSKATAIKNLGMAFDYCIGGLKKMTDTDLQKSVTMQGHSISSFELFWGGFTHTAHHRGQAEVYLRLKGITPPSYKF
jgi:uncharacterized damage-inducible protein DinB